jgi:hypothetical protein
MFHVPRRELEQHFEKVLLEGNARMELKSRANESQRQDLPAASSSIVIGAVLRKVLRKVRRIADGSMFPPGIGANI